MPTTNPVEGNLVTIGDTQLYTHTIGSGTPVLVMHGGLGLDHQYLRPWLDELADVAQITYYDHRGNGRSAPCSFDGVDHATWIDDADALRQHLAHDRVVVFGHSYGGFLALGYALRHPDRVAGLVLVSTAAVMEHWDRIRVELDARSATDAQRRGFSDVPWSSDEDFGAWLGAALPLYFHGPDGRAMARMLATTRISAAASTASGALMARYDVRSQLQQIEVPCLVVGGHHDFITPPDCTTVPLAARLPDAELAMFERSGHFPFIEEHDAFIDVVRSWIVRRARPRLVRHQ